MTDQTNGRIEGLVEQLAPDLLAYFRRRVSPPGDAADLLSETFVVLCRRVTDVPASNAEARLWAFGVARKVLSSQRRSHGRRTALVDRLRSELNRSECSVHDDAVADRLHVALSRLKPIDREIVRLVHWEGFSQAEVASILGRPAITVRSRYTRARNTLRAELEADQCPQGDRATTCGGERPASSQ